MKKWKLLFVKWLLKDYLEDRYIASLVDKYTQDAVKFHLQDALDTIIKQNDVISKSSKDRGITKV